MCFLCECGAPKCPGLGGGGAGARGRQAMHSFSPELCESTMSLPRMGKLRLGDVRTLDRAVSLAHQDLDPGLSDSVV